MFPGRNNWTSRFLEKTASFGPWCRAPTMPLSPLSPRVKSRVRMRTSGSSSVDSGGRSNRNDAERFATDTSRTGNSRNLASNHAVIAILKMAKPMNLAGFVSKKWEFHQPKLGTVKKKRPYCWLMELLCIHCTLESSCRPENAIYIVWTLDAAQQPLRGAEMVLAVRNGGWDQVPHQLNLGGGLEQLDYVSIYIYILGISSSQLTIFFRGVGWNHQPVFTFIPLYPFIYLDVVGGLSNWLHWCGMWGVSCRVFPETEWRPVHMNPDI